MVARIGHGMDGWKKGWMVDEGMVEGMMDEGTGDTLVDRCLPILSWVGSHVHG